MRITQDGFDEIFKKFLVNGTERQKELLKIVEYEASKGASLYFCAMWLKQDEGIKKALEEQEKFELPLLIRSEFVFKLIELKGAADQWRIKLSIEDVLKKSFLLYDIVLTPKTEKIASDINDVKESIKELQKSPTLLKDVDNANLAGMVTRLNKYENSLRKLIMEREKLEFSAARLDELKNKYPHTVLTLWVSDEVPILINENKDVLDMYEITLYPHYTK